MNPLPRRLLRLVSLGALAYVYDRLSFVALNWFSMVELPWMPYWGKSPLTVALLVHTNSALAVLSVALPLGGIAAWCGGARPFVYGLGLAAPAFADQARSTPPLVGQGFFAVLFSFMYCVEVLLPMLLLPAAAAWLLRRWLARRRGEPA